jgi:hypothetical protein
MRHLLLTSCAASLACALFLSVACGSSSSSVTVTAPSSSGCAVQAQTEPPTFSSTGGPGTLHVTTNRECAWSVTTQASWLTLSAPLNGQGAGTVSFTVAPNQNPSSRTGGVNVNDQQVQVSQAGNPCEFHLSSTAESFDGSGGDKTIQVSANSDQCEWTARADDGWIEIVSGQQGKGNGSVGFRAGALTIAGIHVGVEQNADVVVPCTFSVAPASFSFGAGGGTGEVRVTAPTGCAWSAETSLPWIVVTGLNTGSGSGVVTFRVDATDTPSRTGTFKVANTIIAVEQASGCQFSVSPGTYAASSSGGTSAVTVNAAAGCSWTAATASSWITITSGSSGTGPGRVDFTVAPNIGLGRSGTVAVAGQSITITQPSGCRYDLSAMRHDAPPGGDTTTTAVTTAAGCPWTASSSVSWVTASASTQTGPGQVQLVVAANPGPARTGNVAIAGREFTVAQGSLCQFTLNPSSSSYGASGGPGVVLVFVVGSCTWTATTDASWILLDPAFSGTAGSGFVRYSVAANAGAARSATVLIAGMPHTVTQAAK